MAAKKQMLTAVFRNRTGASRAFEWLQGRGYTSDEINVLMSDRTRAAFHARTDAEEKIAAKSKVAEGAATGGAVGTAVGATLGAIAAIGTAVVGPFGLVIAGPIVAALAGGGAGAVAGGAVGALVGLGIPESNTKAYEEALRDGGIVLGVVPRSKEEGSKVKAYFEEHGAENIVYT